MQLAARVSGTALASLLLSCCGPGNPSIGIHDFIYYVDTGPKGAHYFHFFPKDTNGLAQPEGDVSKVNWDLIKVSPSDPTQAHRIGMLCLSQASLIDLKGELEELCSLTTCSQEQLSLMKTFFKNTKIK